MAKARAKTIPAIEPNAGLKASLQKRLIALIQKQTQEAAAELLRDLCASGDFVPTEESEPIAQDAAFTRREQNLVNKALNKYKALHPEAAIAQMDSKMAEKLARWMIHAGTNAKAVSKWFVRATAQNVTASQRRALLRAGISPQLLKEKWSIPIVKNRYISPNAAKALPKLVDDMTGLITKMQADDLARVRETITRGILEGQNLGEIEKTLLASKGFSEARAKRVALDQSVKVNQNIQRNNAASLGLTRGIWVHVPGKYSSRETHIAMNGREFELYEGLYDDDVQALVVPGELPFCRCTFRLNVTDLLK